MRGQILGAPMMVQHIQHITIRCLVVDEGKRYYIGTPESPDVQRFLGGQFLNVLRKEEWTPSPTREDGT